VGVKQIRKDHTIKDSFITSVLNRVLDDYRKKISELGPKLSFYQVKALATYLENGGEIKAESINVIEFGRERIQELQAAKRNASAANMLTVINSLIDYFESEFVPVTEIRAKMLEAYESFLRKPRKLTRSNQFGVSVVCVKKGVSNTGLHNHMRDLRILFNAIREFYNDEDLGVVIVKHYPFGKYKLVNVDNNDKPKLTIKDLKRIFNIQANSGSRKELARDLAKLSFYLCGMNAVDIYRLPLNCIDENRIGYNRSKTSSRRKDKAYINIKVPEEVKETFLKYAGNLQDRYSNHISLGRAISIGMREIGAELNIASLEFYDMRHAFGDLARNKCRFSKDDVGLALNHKDQTNAVTDIYIS